MHIVRTMLAAGAPIDYAVDESIIALGRAIMQRHSKMVKYLLEQGADVNKAILANGGDGTRTPLEYACLTATVWSAAENEFVDKPVSVDILKLLLAAGADVNATDASGKGITALHNLAQARAAAPAEAVQLMIQHGAKVNVRDVSGRTPLMVCVNEHTDTALSLQHIAALISAGADCKLATNAGETPLLWTALWPDERIQMLKLLLKEGADVTRADPVDGHTALFSAVIGGNAEAVQLLLAAGSRVHHRNHYNMTPVFMVRSLPVLNLLLAAGADAKAVSFGGLNVLHWVCMHMEPQPTAAVVCGLIKAGADLTARCSGPDDCTPAQVARRRGHMLIAQLLERDGLSRKGTEVSAVNSSCSACAHRKSMSCEQQQQQL
jgi:ankyrin repeat protein